MKIKKKFKNNKFIWWYEPEECQVNEKPNNGWTEKISRAFKPYVKIWEATKKIEPVSTIVPDKKLLFLQKPKEY